MITTSIFLDSLEERLECIENSLGKIDDSENNYSFQNKIDEIQTVLTELLPSSEKYDWSVIQDDDYCSLSHSTPKELEIPNEFILDDCINDLNLMLSDLTKLTNSHNELLELELLNCSQTPTNIRSVEENICTQNLTKFPNLIRECNLLLVKSLAVSDRFAGIESKYKEILHNLQKNQKH
ncbi:hypothetical protein TBLA_0E01180 [Henningerozyma blattae CBS 6284]|uniref:Uncharacterized protein n=1 Tax=Henningerozyma blattae (strain ATCC 34711 / CBS 6284 / DSM 70876 / NBRC 10599 / NRRL Y-10934 / UCD 77-7) TaxID=1071380 RepID=I2H475_HENB6|nr:hypothetical protein TBLA_0E01180 [Tetrapisispora blattae CBS 6284]CCH61177.1 hypothetical protein TBLA_0E01180 [Tetrapisispora blattae CBS 6284]